MANYELTTDEIAEVRFQTGNRLTDVDLSDTQITSSTVLGAAANYVFEKVREGMNLDLLTDAERLIAERFRDETPEDVANFVNQVLKPPQVKQFRRAIIFYTSGLSMQAVRTVGRETVGQVTQALVQSPSQQERGDWQDRQRFLFEQADLEIGYILKAFPDDAFARKKVTFNLMSLIGGS